MSRGKARVMLPSTYPVFHDVRQHTLVARAGHGHYGEVPGTAGQIIEDVGLHAYAIYLDALVEIGGVAAVINAISREVGERSPVRIGGRGFPRKCRASAAA